jgi:hypothetical protein
VPEFWLWEGGDEVFLEVFDAIEEKNQDSCEYSLGSVVLKGLEGGCYKICGFFGWGCDKKWRGKGCWDAGMLGC